MKKIALSASLAFAGLCLCVLALEIALRAAGYSAPARYQPDPRLGWRLRVGANAEGLRDLEHLADKPAGVYRIAVLGDSYSEARQVDRRQAFWARLPAELAACGFRRGQRIEVLHFGIAGYGTAQAYLMLQSTAIRYQPDLVLLQFAGDDVRNNSFALEPEKERPFFMLGRDGELRLDEGFAGSPGFRARARFTAEAMRKLADRSRLLQLASSSPGDAFFPQAHASSGPEQGALWEEARRVTEGLIAKTADFARRNGARFALVMVPDDPRIAAFAQKDGLLVVPLGTELHADGRGDWDAAGHQAAAGIIARRLCSAGA
jgi:hypothetical protein